MKLGLTIQAFEFYNPALHVPPAKPTAQIWFSRHRSCVQMEGPWLAHGTVSLIKLEIVVSTSRGSRSFEPGNVAAQVGRIFRGR